MLRFFFQSQWLGFAVWLLVVSGNLSVAVVLAENRPAVAFDAPAVIVAEPINPAVVNLPTAGGELYRLRIPVSAFVSPAFRGEVSEYSVEIESPYQTMRVLDFWPQGEVYSEIDGNVQVQQSRQKDTDFSFNASAAYEPIGRATASGQFHDKQNVTENFERKPPMQVLTSSGTVRRGFGAFFKFRPGPVPVLEGAREVALLVEVPRGWRADMLQVSMTATGQAESPFRKQQLLGHTRLWSTVHREGDPAAAAQARRYVTQERSLRALAASFQSRVDKKSLPTVWHKVGAALDVVQPAIPEDYLSQVIFSAKNDYYDNPMTNKLPVDLQVAILDYWDERTTLMHYAHPTATLSATTPETRSLAASK